MRLLNTTSLTFEEFSGREVEPYAILSHCWSHSRGQEEPTYQQVLSKSYRAESPGWWKVTECCRIARSRGLQWTWIDTVCINKLSSAELSETINCMYTWYQRSVECYVLLDDIPVLNDRNTSQREGILRTTGLLPDGFSLSRWFTRGWTLQELLAPASVRFYDRNGDFIGTRSEMATSISYATGIHPLYLRKAKSIEDASVAQRMSWASRRKTTRTEDTAYALMGLFGVSMPLLYGEGEKAFLRLQLAIVEQSDDGSIFAWGINDSCTVRLGMLARGPWDFIESAEVVRLPNLTYNSGSPFQGSDKFITYRYTATMFDLARAAVGWHFDSITNVRLPCKVNNSHSHGGRISINLIRDVNDGTYYRIGVQKLISRPMIEFLCHFIAYEKEVHIATQNTSETWQPASEGSTIMLAKRFSISYRQPLLWLFRSILSMTLILAFLLTDDPKNTKNTIPIAVGAIILARELAPSGFFPSSFAIVLIMYVYYRKLESEVSS